MGFNRDLIGIIYESRGFVHCHPIEARGCQQLRMLVRLSDALTEAATQDWFMIDLRNDQDALSVTVGDLLAFGVKIAGNERFRPGHLAISAKIRRL